MIASDAGETAFKVAALEEVLFCATGLSQAREDGMVWYRNRRISMDEAGHPLIARAAIWSFREAYYEAESVTRWYVLPVKGGPA